MNVKKMKKIMAGIFGTVLSCSILMMPFTINAEEKEILPSGLSYSQAVSRMELLLDEEGNATDAYTAGGAVRFTIDGENIFSRNFGYANIEQKLEINDETVFEWGSASQLLIWVSVLQLSEEGKLNLKDNIANYLPEGELKKKMEPMAISMECLMNYSSGLQDNLFERYVSEDAAYSSLAETLENTIPELVYSVDTVVAQSDWPCALAAYIVESVSGVSYAEYVKVNIFEPLNMTHTALLPDLSDNEWVMEAKKTVQSYQNGIAVSNQQYRMPFYPAGMVTGTMDDFHVFANELLKQDATSLLFDKKETAKTLFDATLQYPKTEEDRIAHGMFVYRFSVPVYGMRGSSMSQMAVVYMEPQTKSCFSYMSNEVNTKELPDAFANIVYGHPQYEEQSEIGGLRAYEGTYVSGNSIVKGRQQFLSVLSAMFVSVNEEKQFVLPMLNHEILLTVVDEHHAVMTSGELINLYTYPDGRTVIMTPECDYVSYSTVKYFSQIAIFFIMITAYFYSSIALLIVIYEFIMQKIRKSKKETDKFKKYHALQCLNTTLFCIYFAYISVMSMSYAPASMIKPASLMFWLGSVMSVIYLLFFWKTGRHEPENTKDKIFYWATAVCAVITILFAALFGLIL